MKRIKWFVASAAFLGLSVTAIVQAQDPFGDPGVSASPASKPAEPAPVDEDLFGPAVAAPQPAPIPNTPLQPSPNRPPVELPNQNLCRCEGENNQVAIAKINHALNTPLRGSGLDFTDTPLEEVVNFLQEEYSIPIQIDIAALDEIGVAGDEPVNINLHGVSFRSALRLMLKQHQLTFIVDDEVLLITTPEEADSRIKVCVYDVRHLVDGHTPIALKELTDVVTSSVSGDTWTQSGSGRGSVRSYPPNLLIISQTQAVHEQIQDLLKRMREMRQGPRENGQPAPAARK